MLWLKLELKLTRPTYIGIVYRPPSGNLEHFIDLLENRVLDIEGEGYADVLVMGDTNINILLRNDSKKQLYTAMLKRMKLSSLITEPTRITTHSKTCIDHIVTNRNVMYNNAGVIDMGL